MHERYSIQVDEESVEIYGELTIEEAFDFLSFFERKGYKSLILGTENSTLHLLKKDQKEAIVDERITNLLEQVTDYKDWLQKEKTNHEQTKEKLLDVERLLKQLMSEEYKKYKKLHDENQELMKAQAALFLHENPEVQKMLIEGNFQISRPLTEEEIERRDNGKND